MKDKYFLLWLHERLLKVHGESPYVDYMHKLRAIIQATPEDQETPNVSSSTNPLEYSTYVGSTDILLKLEGENDAHNDQE
jgi:hypothetical protein